MDYLHISYKYEKLLLKKKLAIKTKFIKRKTIVAKENLWSTIIWIRTKAPKGDRLILQTDLRMDGQSNL